MFTVDVFDTRVHGLSSWPPVHTTHVHGLCVPGLSTLVQKLKHGDDSIGRWHRAVLLTTGARWLESGTLAVTLQMTDDRSSITSGAYQKCWRHLTSIINNNNVRLLQLQSERYNRTNICHAGQHWYNRTQSKCIEPNITQGLARVS